MGASHYVSLQHNSSGAICIAKPIYLSSSVRYIIRWYLMFNFSLKSGYTRTHTYTPGRYLYSSHESQPHMLSWLDHAMDIMGFNFSLLAAFSSSYTFRAQRACSKSTKNTSNICQKIVTIHSRACKIFACCSCSIVALFHSLLSSKQRGALMKGFW